MDSSYLSILHFARRNLYHYLEWHIEYNQSHCVHDSESSRDRLDCVQDFQGVPCITASNEKFLSVIHAGKRNLCSIIFIIIESGMALFAIQLARLVVAATGLGTDRENAVYQLIIGTHEMLNVVISSVIVTLYSADNVAARV